MIVDSMIRDRKYVNLSLLWTTEDAKAGPSKNILREK